MPEKLLIKAEMIEIMRSHVLRCIPEEGCGILGGSGVHVKCVLPITNELHSPVKFRMAPEEQFKAFVWLEENSFQMLGYYHSHPSGPAYPSETDFLQFSYPGVVLVLLSPEDSTLQLKGFIIKKNAINEINLEIDRS